MNIKKLSFAVITALTLGATSSFAVNVGDTVTFGRYPVAAPGDSGTAAQMAKKGTDANSSRGVSEKQEKRRKTSEAVPISWIVLKVEENRALIISAQELDCVKYNKKRQIVTWENCTLRKWLNNDFINAAFTKSEQEKICTVTLQTPPNPNAQDKVPDCKPTQDKVFCLSIQEAEELIPSDEARACKATPWALAHGAWAMEEGRDKDISWWWLRSPGDFDLGAAYVDTDGGIIKSGWHVDRYGACVRPAMWVTGL